DQLIGRGEHEVWVAELLHDQERLRVPCHLLARKPGTKAPLVAQALFPDPPVPLGDTSAGLLFEEADPHFPVSLPVKSVCHAALAHSRTATSSFGVRPPDSKTLCFHRGLRRARQCPRDQ